MKLTKGGSMSLPNEKPFPLSSLVVVLCLVGFLFSGYEVLKRHDIELVGSLVLCGFFALIIGLIFREKLKTVLK